MLYIEAINDVFHERDVDPFGEFVAGFEEHLQVGGRRGTKHREMEQVPEQMDMMKQSPHAEGIPQKYPRTADCVGCRNKIWEHVRLLRHF